MRKKSKTYPNSDDIYRLLNKCQIDKTEVKFYVPLVDLPIIIHTLEDTEIDYTIKKNETDALIELVPNDVDYEGQVSSDMEDLLDELKDIEPLDEEIYKPEILNPLQLQRKKNRASRKEQNKEYGRVFREKHREETREYNRKRYQLKKEEIAKQMHEYYERNKAKMLERGNKYYQDHKEEQSKKARARYYKNKK